MSRSALLKCCVQFWEKKKTKQKDRNYLEEIIYNWSDIYWLVLPKIMWTQLDMEFLNEFQEPAAINGTKMGDLPLFLRLILCSCATLGLTIGEFLVSNYTHSITLLGAFYPHLLKLLFIYWFYSWMNTLEPVCCKKQQKKAHNQLLVCRIGRLKDMNDSKLIAYESKWFPWSSRINFIPFRLFRGPLFYKPVTVQELFLLFLTANRL